MACLKYLPIPVPAGGGDIDAIDERQPAEIDAEDQDQQQPGEECRQRKADKGKRVGDLVEDRIGPHRGIDADRQRDRQRQNLRRADHEQRRRDALQDQLVDVDAACERKAPVAVQHRDQPVQVANENRIVDPEFHPQRRPDLGRNIGVGGEFAERIARRQRQQHKKNEADAEQAGKSDDQAPENVFSHRRPAAAAFRFFASQVSYPTSRLPIPARDLLQVVVPAAEMRDQIAVQGRDPRPVDDGQDIIVADRPGR